MKHIGLDAGSVAVKIIVLNDSRDMLESAYLRHKGRPLHVCLQLLRNTLDKSSGEQRSLSLTGSAGRLIGTILGIAPVNEVVAHAYATRRLYPDVRTIIELGGEDSKLIFLDQASCSAKDFAMNSVCAAGTGSFLDQQAERLNLSIEEFSRLSLDSGKPPKIAGRCSVFAKSDMIHLQQIATPVQDIAAGLCFAVARNFKGSIAKGLCLEKPVSFQGGVAANMGMVRAFREVFCLEDIFIPAEFALMGAIGAAWKDLDSGRVNAFDLSRLQDFIQSDIPQEKGYSPLVLHGADFRERHLTVESAEERDEELTHPSSLIPHPSSPPLRAYLGVDIGSISTNLAVIDDKCNVLAKRYLMTAGRPIEAVKQGLKEINQEIGDRISIAGVGTTGSGRYMIADYIGSDIVKNEITAQATAAAFIDPEVDTIFEIGGQDSKYISLKNGVIVDFEMNKACAAGTGSFIEEQAEKLNISVKGEFQDIAMAAANPCRLGERCTVFMENSLMANLQRGLPKEDLLSGLAYSIVQNYINRVVCKRTIGNRIFFQGGVAFNKAVVAAFENYLGKKVIVPRHHDVTGAIGMALIAREHMEKDQAGKPGLDLSYQKPGTRNPKQVSSFKGFEASQRPYSLSSFECSGCPNVCEINRINVQGEKDHLYYGGRCEKYDVRKRSVRTGLPDLFAFRDEMLWQAHNDRKDRHALVVTGNGLKDEKFPGRSNIARQTRRGKIGIPYIFYFHDYLPYWSTLLWELGFEVSVSPITERSIIDLGNETILAETCFPVKAAHGHIAHLIQKQVDALFVPSFINLSADPDPAETCLACPYTQAMPYMAKTAFPDSAFIMPAINLSRGRKNLKKELLRSLKHYNISSSEMIEAMAVAEQAQDAFVQAIKKKGREVLSALKEKALVIVGRAYNSFDKGMNLDIPKKINNLGVLTIPMDFLPLEKEEIRKDWPNMYWRAGQKILSAGRIISSNPMLEAVIIGNFSCGPDSFILKFFEEEMAGKSFLHLELDAHSADAGAITRCEAFLDSIKNRDSRAATINRRGKILRETTPSHTNYSASRTIYIPHMSDHALAVAAAFSYCGSAAEMLPEPTQASVDLGRRFVSGKECYPCAITIGDMTKKIMEPGFDPKRSVFFMPSGTGPCRFGQYNVFQRQVIRDLGMEDALEVYSPNQNEDFYKHLGLAGKGYAMRVWEGVVSISLLRKCLLETRPYEKEKGAADSIYQQHLQKLCSALGTRNGDIEEILTEARKAFERIPLETGERPLIGIVGEIFVRSNRFSNEHLVRKIEALGAEVYLTPVDEWISYVNLMGIHRVLIKKDLSGMITLLSKRFFQKRVEHRLGKPFHGFLRTLHEPDIRMIMQHASPYIRPSFEGEAVLSIGKSIDLAKRGSSGIINAMPFGCMPGTIVSAVLRAVKNNHGIPYLSIPYDGTESLTTGIQLEAFIDQAKEYKDRRQDS